MISSWNVKRDRYPVLNWQMLPNAASTSTEARLRTRERSTKASGQGTLRSVLGMNERHCTKPSRSLTFMREPPMRCRWRGILGSVGAAGSTGRARSPMPGSWGSRIPGNAPRRNVGNCSPRRCCSRSAGDSATPAGSAAASAATSRLENASAKPNDGTSSAARPFASSPRVIQAHASSKSGTEPSVKAGSSSARRASSPKDGSPIVSAICCSTLTSRPGKSPSGHTGTGMAGR